MEAITEPFEADTNLLLSVAAKGDASLQYTMTVSVCQDYELVMDETLTVDFNEQRVAFFHANVAEPRVLTLTVAPADVEMLVNFGDLPYTDNQLIGVTESDGAVRSLTIYTTETGDYHFRVCSAFTSPPFYDDNISCTTQSTAI